MELVLAVIFGGLCLALIAYVIGAQADEKATVRESLRQLEGYEVENVRDQELLVPFSERALTPVLGGLSNLGRRFTPVGYVDNVRRKFVYAGMLSTDLIDRFLAVRVLSVALIPVVFIFVYLWNPIGFEGLLQFGAFALLALVLVLGPDAWLNRRVG